MRFELARQRLSQLPVNLPPPPAELTPMLLSAPNGESRGVRPFPAGPSRDAAVLVLVHPDPDGEARLVLTERAVGGHRHAGQVSLPGGAIDATDESIVAAALREASEEVGLRAEAAGVIVVGVVAPVEVRVSGFRVHPVIALAPRSPPLTASAHEVAAIINAPLAAFLPGAPIEIVTAEWDGAQLRYGAYRVGRHMVWGATAGILGRLGAFLAGR